MNTKLGTKVNIENEKINHSPTSRGPAPREVLRSSQLWVLLATAQQISWQPLHRESREAATACWWGPLGSAAAR